MKKQLKIYGAAFITGLVLGPILYKIQPTYWHGNGILSVGSFMTTAAGPLQIQSLASVSEQLKSKAFMDKVLNSLEAKNIKKENMKEISIKQLRDNTTILIQTTGSDRVTAKEELDAISSQILDEHDQILNRYKSGILKQIEVLEKEIKNLHCRKAILKKSDQLSSKDNVDLDCYLSEHYLENKLDRIDGLNSKISTENIIPSRLIGEVSATETRWLSTIWVSLLFSTSLCCFVVFLYLRQLRKLSE